MHSKIRGIVFCLLSFVLSFVLLLLSISVMLEATILNPSYILDNMNTTNYFTDKKDEITRELVDLGYASGLEESFFGNVVETVTIHDDTEDYLESYYAASNRRSGSFCRNPLCDYHLCKPLEAQGGQIYLLRNIRNIYYGGNYPCCFVFNRLCEQNQY